MGIKSQKTKGLETIKT